MKRVIPITAGFAMIVIALIGFFAVVLTPLSVGLVPIGLGAIGVITLVVTGFNGQRRNNCYAEGTARVTRQRSIAVLVVTCLFAVFFTCMAIFYGPQAFKNTEGWERFIYIIAIGPISGVGLLGFSVIPSTVIYRTSRQHIDRLSFLLSRSLLGLVILTWVIFLCRK